MRKGQATMREVGLAALIMVVLILYLYLTSPKVEPTVFKESCSLKGNLTCRSLFLRRGSSKLELAVEQNTGRAINITSLVCTKTSQPPVMPLLNATIPIPSGGWAYVAGGNSGNDVVCTESDGRVPQANLGDIYEGYLYIAYVDKTGQISFVNGTVVTKYS